MRERGVDSIHDLADDPRYGPTYTQYMHVATRVRAVEAAQTHLRCEALLDPRAETGVLDDVTHAGAAISKQGSLGETDPAGELAGGSASYFESSDERDDVTVRIEDS